MTLVVVKESLVAVMTKVIAESQLLIVVGPETVTAVSRMVLWVWLAVRAVGRCSTVSNQAGRVYEGVMAAGSGVSARVGVLVNQDGSTSWLGGAPVSIAGAATAGIVLIPIRLVRMVIMIVSAKLFFLAFMFLPLFVSLTGCQVVGRGVLCKMRWLFLCPGFEWISLDVAV